MKLKKLLLKIVNASKSIVNTSPSEPDIGTDPEPKKPQEIIPTLVDAITVAEDNLDLNSLDIPILTEVVTDTQPSQHESCLPSEAPRPPSDPSGSPFENDTSTSAGDDADQPV